jgi:putative endonuclease
MFFTYVLQNPQGILYKGQTNNLKKRILLHNSDDGFHSFTKHRGPWQLVYSENFATRAEASRREKFLKSGQGRAFLKNHLKTLEDQDL